MSKLFYPRSLKTALPENLTTKDTKTHEASPGSAIFPDALMRASVIPRQKVVNKDKISCGLKKHFIKWLKLFDG